jgi:Uma2 family endonuclease
MVDLPLLAHALVEAEPMSTVRYRRFTVDELRQLVGAGVLGEDDRVELISGVLIDMAPIGDEHVSVTNILNELLLPSLLGRAVVSVQNPIRLSDSSLPQPDIVVYARSAAVERRMARPDEVFLVIEVSDTTLVYDRTVKLPLYAEAGIPEVWIVNLPEQQIEVYREAGPGGYKSMRRILRGETVAPEAFPDLLIATDAIL